MPEPYVEKEFGRLSQLAISAGSNQPPDLVVRDALPVIVFLDNVRNSLSLFHMSFYEQSVKSLSHNILLSVSPDLIFFHFVITSIATIVVTCD
jgi:hypothetical protein